MGDEMKDFRDPKFWASVSAWMVVVAIVVLWPIGIYKNWNISEIGTIIGALAGPFAGLAGFLYIYVTFKQQNNHFKVDQNNQMFFRLLNSFILVRDRITYSNKLNLDPEYVQKRKEGDFSFKEIIEHLITWSTNRSKGWPSLTEVDFNKRGNNYEFIKYPQDFSFETVTRNQLEFLFKAVGDEETLGAYFRSFENIIGFCFKNELGNYLQILEAHMGKNERVYLHYHCALRIDTELMLFMTSNKFLLSVASKHLIKPNHEKFLYPDKSIFQNKTILDPENIILD